MTKMDNIKQKYASADEGERAEDIFVLLKRINHLENENIKLIEVCKDQARALDVLNRENNSLCKQIILNELKGYD